MSMSHDQLTPQRSLDKVLNAPERTEPEGFILRLAKSLHTYGVPAYELEKLIQDCGSALGFGIQCMSLPTSITITLLRENSIANSYVIRADPGDIDLEKLTQVSEVAHQVINQKLSTTEGARQLQLIAQAKPLYSQSLNLLALAVVSFGITRIFSGGIREMLAGALLGTVVGIILLLSQRLTSLKPILPTFCALAVVILSNLINSYLFPISSYAVMVSALIILLPGLNLTIAITELATQNLVSGTARLSGAVLVFLQLGLGLAVGEQISRKFLPTIASQDIFLLPNWTLWCALMLASMALIVPFNARFKHSHWFVLAGLLAFGSSSLFSQYFGASLGAFFGAICIGLCANVVKRYFDLPGSVILLPGFLILVPGSIGFQSIAAIVEHDVLKAGQIAINTLMTGLSLVMGLLLSSLTTFNFKK